MNLYKISIASMRYDTYDSAIVVAENKAKARLIHPDGGRHIPREERGIGTWVNDPRIVTVQLIGKTNYAREQVILASFNAG